MGEFNMISKAYRKLCTAIGLKFVNGVCCGELCGYTVTLSDGGGFKDIYISAYTDGNAFENLSSAADSFRKKYKLNAFEVKPDFIYIRFFDGIGTIKRIEDFINKFFPALSEYGVRADICPHCKNSLDTGSTAKLIYGHAVKLHSGCAEEIINNMKETEEHISIAESNAGKGTVGAILFGLAASIPWAVVYALGWFVGWLGWLIGLGVVKGYEKFGGRLKKSVIPAFALIIILCVIFAQFLGDALQLGYYINNGEIYGSLSDIPEYIKILLTEDAEYQKTVIGNIIIGLLFAGLGVYGIFRSLINQVKSHSKKITDLDI